MWARGPKNLPPRACELTLGWYTRSCRPTSRVQFCSTGLPGVEKKSLAMESPLGLQKRFGKLAPASYRGAGACLRKACCGELRLYRLAGDNGLRTRQHVSFVPCDIGLAVKSTFAVAKWSVRPVSFE